MAGQNVLEFSNANWQAKVLDSEQPVVVDFWAPWCGPCRMLTPIIDKLATQFAGKVKVGKVDTDAQQELAASFGIRSIPTLMIIRDNVVLYAQPGALPAAALEELITKARELDMDEVRASIAEHEGAQQAGSA